MERRLISGELVDLGGKGIRGELIRELLVKGDSLDPRGLRIKNATIEGQLDLCDVAAKRPLTLRDCQAEEPVLLDRAQLSALILNGLTAPAVRAPWLRVEHYLLLQNAQLGEAERAVDLTEANIGSHLNLSGTHLDGEPALYAPKLRTGSQVFLNDLRAQGTILLDWARIGGNLHFAGAELRSDGQAALHAVDMQVDETVFLHNGFSATGPDYAVRIRGSRIGGQLVLRRARATGRVALDIKQVRLGQELFFPMEFADGPVELDGLTYIGLPRDATLDEWLDLLANRTYFFANQPYLQLAATHQAAGHERDVRRIRIAQQRDLIRRGQLTRRSRLWHRITGLTVGYGYRPSAALGWLAATLAVAILMITAIAGPAGLTRNAGTSCSVVEQIGLALNAATPLIKPDSQQRCQLVTSTGLGQGVLLVTWILQGLAWAFATLFVAGFTGLVRKSP